MTTKLTDNASLGELMTTFDSIKNDLQIEKNNIINAIGSPANINDKLSIIPSRMTTVLTEKNNTINQLSKFKYAHGSTAPFFVEGRNIVGYFDNITRKQTIWLDINNLSFKPNLFVAEREYLGTSDEYMYKLIIVAYRGLDSTGNGDKGKDFVMNYRLNSSGINREGGNFYVNDSADVWFKDNSIQVPAYTHANANYSSNYKWHAFKVF
ncbi:TPA: hypothetical protein ACMVTQ_003936 [Clostridioides difficile]|uniref:hypothetical protein n=2 Tax=Clostridioides difficile TaxID=1496 RepID=UPI00038CC5EF|nr:hypothetical protein [Clostridioides difficile]EQG78656.1 hypothetical protein QKA_0364 [Clostridioides difficile DA00165]EAA0008377.1 hypothetical protein [Clostridioides difficile]EGT3777083.1 hypothetical protein [Clostridioides difficile]EGT3817987.1 hypothetical protein [Clostridioides difficile]EGT3855843.1 hypothetical protein [Clostridioides difficile]